ncbi:Cytochrome c oxidase assembly protein cox11, mitochondrial [Blastocladiella emersonii ATCC 22665]|nr:Cytochrome c oxidase assembly protein cox11, mitochondrial [Blastocladiella emersonii ATCC 22665]
MYSFASGVLGRLAAPAARTAARCSRLVPRHSTMVATTESCSSIRLAARRRFATEAPKPAAESVSGNNAYPGATAQQRGAWAHYERKNALRNQSALYYSAAVFITFIGLSYTAVPLYRLFCSTTGVGGTVKTSLESGEADPRFQPSNMVPVTSSNRRLRIKFNSDTARALNWSFKPQQREVNVVPGETALAFYTAKNNSDQDVIGISTYNVIPAHAGPYFNKIQCFCFEEQKLRAGEEVDMPVFFFIDPSFLDDPNTDDINEITLSYSFFNARTIDANRLHALNPQAQQVAENAIAAGQRVDAA